MPIYEYVCGGCHLKFERYLKAWGDAVSCPRCEASAVEKQLSRFALGGGTSAAAEQAAATPGRACCGGSCGCAH